MYTQNKDGKGDGGAFFASSLQAHRVAVGRSRIKARGWNAVMRIGSGMVWDALVDPRSNRFPDATTWFPERVGFAGSPRIRTKDILSSAIASQ